MTQFSQVKLSLNTECQFHLVLQRRGPSPQPSGAGWRSQERSVVIICSWGINTCCWVHFAPYVFFSKNRTLTECVLGQWSGKNLWLSCTVSAGAISEDASIVADQKSKLSANSIVVLTHNTFMIRHYGGGRNYQYNTGEIIMLHKLKQSTGL